ncbi:MAG: FAD-dependent oxidoreductase [Cyclobacteriaceae bacterium]
MLEKFEEKKRDNTTLEVSSDFVIVGGGIAGVCAAIAAARKGTKTVLVQDRPVLGGNASSEVRLWILGATSHMGNNNRWSREGGVMDEILVENLYKNKEGNAVIFDTILLDKVIQEENITLLLNTCIFEVSKSDDKTIESVVGFNSQNSTKYIISAPLFCDASGDGLVAFQAGASFRMGAETREEFGELFAPDQSYGELLGHSMYFYSKSAGELVAYTPPSFALADITEIPRYKLISKTDMGCRFWWFEYGGRTDTIHNTEAIKWELWKVIYGVWNHIKNSGEFEDVDDLTLEWVATVPGKRESRRFEGLYMLKQQDVIEQRTFEDAVAHGGWALDLHPADGVYSEKSGCTQWHSKGVYQIPYRCYVSKDIHNLFYAGRIISATHVAFGSSRVMATCGTGGQVVGEAAALCKDKNLNPADLTQKHYQSELQDRLNHSGQSILALPIKAESNQASDAKISASSNLSLANIPSGSTWLNLGTSAAQLLPLKAEVKYTFDVKLKAEEPTSLDVQLRVSHNSKNYAPEVILEQVEIQLEAGQQEVSIAFEQTLKEDQYAFVTFMSNAKVSILESENRMTGVMTVFNGKNKAVSNDGSQRPPAGIGVDSFEFWIPKRRPEGKNMAMQITPSIDAFDSSNIGNGYVRPWGTANSWTAELTDMSPELHLKWDEEKSISEIKLFLDTDYDHAMESTLMGHPESVIPFCIRNYKIKSLEGVLLFEVKGNYQTINSLKLENTIKTKGLTIEVEHPSENVPASIFEVIVS